MKIWSCLYRVRPSVHLASIVYSDWPQLSRASGQEYFLGFTASNSWTLARTEWGSAALDQKGTSCMQSRSLSLPYGPSPMMWFLPMVHLAIVVHICNQLFQRRLHNSVCAALESRADSKYRDNANKSQTYIITFKNKNKNKIMNDSLTERAVTKA